MNDQFSSFGRITQERLNALNRDEEWLLKHLAERRIYLSHERYQQIITGQFKSKPTEIAIGKLISEEENVQRLARKIGIRRG